MTRSTGWGAAWRGGLLGLCGLAGAARAQEAPVDAAMAARPLRQAVSWSVEVDAPRELRELLLKHLDVARYRKQAQAQSAEVAPAGDAGAALSITLGELRRLVAATPAQARQLLETEGYFAAQVQARLTPGGAPDDEAEVRVHVEPGQQARVGSVVLLFQGELDRLIDQQDAAARALASRLQSDWPLPPGDAFSQSKWAAAKSALLTTLRAQGYLSAGWSGTSARVDEQTQAVSLFLIADSGPLYHFGALRVEGLERIKPEAVANLTGFGEGAPYTDKQLFDFQDRLQKSGLFSSVAVSLEPDQTQAGGAPVVVRLKEQSMQQSTFGVGYSANTGARVSLEQVSRQVFGWDWQAKTVIELGSHQSTFKSDFTSHPLPGLRHNLFSVAVEHLEAAGATTQSQSLKVGRSRDEERIDRTFYVEWQRARVVGSDSRSTEASAVTGNMQWVRRQLDNVMAPTQGFATAIDVALGESFATDQSNGLFGRLLWRTLVYQPLPGLWFASGRLDLGRVQARPGVGVPDTLLFRAGGDDSVRGYDYRSIGPTRDGVAVGGRSLVTGSAELAHPIWANRPAWLWAVFADAGDAVDDVSNLQMRTGYGVGLRWRSPVGALRVDLAYGQHVHQTKLHLSLGMAF
ncbi:autotransporter assembly complex family protein [Aquabacterium sp.]|uniref:autotransporter assembly complex protein TamA n=1 Tax=Aquabacterium sp. TaxID=1872578 RepID=UPI0035B26C00